MLTASIPAWTGAKDFVLTAALELMDAHKIRIAALDPSTVEGYTALRGIVTHNELPTGARSKALELIDQANPADIDGLLATVIRDTPDEVALTAIRLLARRSPAAAVAPIEAALASGRPLLARHSWKLLAGIPGEAADGLFIKYLELLRNANGVSPHAIELMEAARQRGAAPVSAALAALEKSLAENPDPLAKWNIALEGGDPAAGNALFTSHPSGECMRCHQVGQGHDIGGDTAPNLAGIANRRQDRRYFLESMLKPSAVIAPGFGVVAIDFKNGASLSGNVIAATAEHLDFDLKGTPVRIKRSDIASVSDPVSAMPPMGELLSPSEVRDLIAWLASLKQDDAPVPVAVTPLPFDPATLAVPEKSATASAIDPEVLKTGRVQFIVCGACHGQSGEGTAAGPPLAGSEWVNGPAENLIRIQLRGLQGPITVKGQTYNFPAGMAALAYQNDAQIAAVLTYVRNSFGNSAPAVTAAEVAALRGEVGKPILTAADLVPPAAASSASPPAGESKAPATTPANPYDDLQPASNLPKWIAAAVVAFAGILAFLILKPQSKDS
jgi:putative heme-binding domain-containing protein